MARTWLLLGLGLVMGVLASCGPSGTNCNCVSTAACSTANQATETCGVGLVCCPAAQAADGG